MATMNCELLATCSALGFLEGDTYHKEPDCLETVKDLIRFLRREDDSKDIRQQLGDAMILQNDLVPLLLYHHNDQVLFQAIIRLLVNLTQPAIVLFGKVPTDPTTRHHYLAVTCHLQAYKQAFANEKVFTVLSETLYNLLQLEWEQRQEEDTLLIERMLLLVRNVMHVPPDPTLEKNVDDDASLHDRVLWALHMSGMDDLLRFLCSAPSEQQWCMHVLEIVCLMFRMQTPSQLVSTGGARPEREKEADTTELELLRQRELAEKRNRMWHRSSRHSRFVGTYVVQGHKSISDNDLVFHLGVQKLAGYSHDIGKEPQRRPKRRLLAPEAEERRRSAMNVRLFLRTFCIDFLDACYNRLMYSVKDTLLLEKGQQNDESYYMWALAFFMEFNRLRGFRPELVSETVGVRTFHFIEKNLTNCYEMMLMEKKDALPWSRRMHLALKAYQELIMTLEEMDKSKEESVRESGNVIKSNLFYVMEYRELFVTLFRKFDETKQPRSFLRDLVETTHTFLRLLQRFCRGRKAVVVQKKRVKRKKKSRAQAQPSSSERSPEECEAQWQQLSQQLIAYAQHPPRLREGEITQGAEAVPDSAVPFDAASEVPVEEQRGQATARIQAALLAGQAGTAVGLLRSAREVWPEGEVFGAVGITPEDELELLRQIHAAKLPSALSASVVEDVPVEDDVGPEEMEEEENEEVEAVSVSEKEFNFTEYIKRFASAPVMKACMSLLRGYRENSAHTNHCIVVILHRVTVGLHMEGLLFQLSAFRVFQAILADPAAHVYQELSKFARHIVRKFFEVAAQNNKSFVELLFWKSPANVHEMTEGYGSAHDGGGLSKKGPRWTEEEQTELDKLFSEFQDQIGGSQDKDVVDHIMERIRDATRTRKQIVAQLVRQGLVNSSKELKRRKGVKLVLWREEQEMELQRLFEEFHKSDDLLDNIVRNLTAKRSRKKVADKLLSMGLVSDRAQLRRKRPSKSSGKSSGKANSNNNADPWGDDHDHLDVDSDDEKESSEDEGSSDDDQPIQRAGARPAGARPAGARPAQAGPARAGPVRPRKSQGGNRNARRKSRPLVKTSPAELRKLVSKARRGGLAEPVLWLGNCLRRTADDREEDGISLPVPLVPLSEENEDAMENRVFRRLLRALGVCSPANHEETFWRIPAELTPSRLREISDCLSALTDDDDDDGDDDNADAGDGDGAGSGDNDEVSDDSAAEREAQDESSEEGELSWGAAADPVPSPVRGINSDTSRVSSPPPLSTHARVPDDDSDKDDDDDDDGGHGVISQSGGRRAEALQALLKRRKQREPRSRRAKVPVDKPQKKRRNRNTNSEEEEEEQKRGEKRPAKRTRLLPDSDDDDDDNDTEAAGVLVEETEAMEDKVEDEVEDSPGSRPVVTRLDDSSSGDEAVPARRPRQRVIIDEDEDE
uniref:Protein timeless homolog isoform X4 n=1 Tax=Petromyzon marinus TaxID=7757 RepID=A0AAJ7T8B5_PETMA|nr:protein timeless homolog isoform X4 [Petromyzon marinus]